MRIFFAPHHTATLPLEAQKIPLVMSARRPAVTPSITKLIQNEFKLTTPNTGNLVHNEAPSDILSCSDRDSVRANLGTYLNLHARKVGMDKAVDDLVANYDAIVISMANDLRTGIAGDYYSSLAALLRRSPIPVHILGLGLQNDKLRKNHLKPEIVEFIEACNEHATTFGVRCEFTEHWLHQEGYSNAKALGCPSMFRSPLGVLRAAQSRLQSPFSTLSAGYLNLQSRHEKLESILLRLQPYKTAYVFQNDLVSLAKDSPYSDREGVYNYWTGSLDSNVISMMYHNIHGKMPIFSEYKAFTDVRAWIAYSSLFSLFIGDRLHGCIAALTAGTPGILLYQDARVKGLAEFFSIPSVNIASPECIEDAVEMVSAVKSGKMMTDFLDTYVKRIRAFKEHLDKVGLAFNSRTLSEYESLLSSYEKSRTTVPV
jgi:hypothetical protein